MMSLNVFYMFDHHQSQSGQMIKLIENVKTHNFNSFLP